MMCERALSRETPGSLLADKQFVQGYIADSYAQLMQFRLFVLYTAWEIDKYNDYKRVRKDIAAVKVVMPTVLHDIAWRAMQVHGALGDHQRDAVLRDDPRRRCHGPGRRADRGAQGHRGPPGAARLQAERRHVADGVHPEQAGRGPGEVRRATSSSRWGTCDRRRPAGRRGWTSVGLPGKGEPIEQRYVSGGSQNEIYEIRRGELHGAMRIPPPSAPESRDDGHPARVADHRGARRAPTCPHTAAIAVCADTSVLGRTFYLMGFVDGWSPMETRTAWPAPFDTDLEARKGLAYQLVEGIALLGNVDWQGEGPRGPGRPDGFHDRQVDRWTAFLERIKGRELPGLRRRGRRGCATHRPIDFIPGLMHGDYQFANVMFKHGAPARLAAHRRLGDGHRRRPEARPGVGRAELAGGHERPVAVRRGLCRHVRHAVTRTSSCSTTPRSRAARSTTSTTTSSWPSGSSRWCSSRGTSAAGDDEKLQAFGPDRPRPHEGCGRAGRDDRLPRLRHGRGARTRRAGRPKAARGEHRTAVRNLGAGQRPATVEDVDHGGGTVFI